MKEAFLDAKLLKRPDQQCAQNGLHSSPFSTVNQHVCLIIFRTKIQILYTLTQRPDLIQLTLLAIFATISPDDGSPLSKGLSNFPLWKVSQLSATKKRTSLELEIALTVSLRAQQTKFTCWGDNKSVRFDKMDEVLLDRIWLYSLKAQLPTFTSHGQ